MHRDMCHAARSNSTGVTIILISGGNVKCCCLSQGDVSWRGQQLYRDHCYADPSQSYNQHLKEKASQE